MALSVNTGRVETRSCQICGREVVHREWQTVTCVDARGWSAEPHDAPCGLPCAARLTGRVIAAARVAGKQPGEVVHGWRGTACTACGFKRTEEVAKP